MKLSTWNTLWKTAAISNLSLSFSMLSSYHSGLSECNFSIEFHLELRCLGLNSHSHMVNDDTFLTRSHVAEWCWPSFKRFKTKGETILTRLESATLINHCLVFSEHIPCFKIRAFEILITRISNIFGSMIITAIILWFRVRYCYRILLFVLNLHRCGKSLRVESKQLDLLVEVYSDHYEVEDDEVVVHRPTWHINIL